MMDAIIERNDAAGDEDRGILKRRGGWRWSSVSKTGDDSAI